MKIKVDKNTRENEGFIIIKSEQYSENYEIVLAVKNSHNFVTWESKINQNNYFWGHYFDNENHALIDYHRRLIERYTESPIYIPQIND